MIVKDEHRRIHPGDLGLLNNPRTRPRCEIDRRYNVATLLGPSQKVPPGGIAVMVVGSIYVGATVDDDARGGCHLILAHDRLGWIFGEWLEEWL